MEINCLEIGMLLRRLRQALYNVEEISLPKLLGQLKPEGIKILLLYRDKIILRVHKFIVDRILHVNKQKFTMLVLMIKGGRIFKVDKYLKESTKKLNCKQIKIGRCRCRLDSRYKRLAF